MNKEQIDEIALRLAGGVLADSSVGRTTIDFTHALLAELAKVQEPVAMYCGYNHSMGHVFRADAVIEVGTYLYTQPLPQPDLDAEQDKGMTDVQLDSDSNHSGPVELRELDGKVEMGQLLGNSQNSETGNSEIKRNLALIGDTFRGDNEALIASIEALIALNDSGCLIPHGIGGHARELLASAALRLIQQPDLDAEIERLKVLSVNNIMLDVVPGDGSGKEVYAKSVDDVVKALTRLSEKAEDLFSTERRLESYIKEAEKLRQQLSAAQASESELLKALEEVEAKYFALLKDEDAEAEGFKAEGDMYGWNFHTGVHTGAVQMHLYMTNLLKLAATHKERKDWK